MGDAGAIDKRPFLLTRASFLGSLAAAAVEGCLFSIRTVVACSGEHRELNRFRHGRRRARGASAMASRSAWARGYNGYNMCLVYLGSALAFSVWRDSSLSQPDQPGHRTGVAARQQHVHAILELALDSGSEDTFLFGSSS